MEWIRISPILMLQSINFIIYSHLISKWQKRYDIFHNILLFVFWLSVLNKCCWRYCVSIWFAIPHVVMFAWLMIKFLRQTYAVSVRFGVVMNVCLVWDQRMCWFMSYERGLVVRAGKAIFRFSKITPLRWQFKSFLTQIVDVC